MSKATKASDFEWALVPREPTDEMAVAFAEEWFSRSRTLDDPELEDAYAAMLAAAPKPESAEAVDFWVCPDCDHYYMEGGIVCDCHGGSTQKCMRHVRMVPDTAPPRPEASEGEVFAYAQDCLIPGVMHLKSRGQPAVFSFRTIKDDLHSFPLYTAPQQASAPVGVEGHYHPCTHILIEGLKRLDGGDAVLAEWDRERTKASAALAQQPTPSAPVGVENKATALTGAGSRSKSRG